MKQTKLLRLTLLLITLLWGAGSVWAGDFNGTNSSSYVTVPGKFDLSYGSYAGFNRDAFFSDANKIEYSKSNCTATFKFAVSEAGTYILSLEASNGNTAGTYNTDLSVKIYSENESEPIDATCTFTVPDNDNWNDFKYYMFQISSLSAGNYILKIKWSDQANVKNIKLSNTYSNIPATTTFSLEKTAMFDYYFKHGNGGLQNSGNLGYIQDGDYVTYLINNTSERDYEVSFDAASQQAGDQVTVKVWNLDGTTITPSAVSITNQGANTYNSYSVSLGSLTTGPKLLQVNFSVGSDGTYASNLKNLCINAPAATYTTVYNLATAIATNGNIEGGTGSLAPTTAEAAANAPNIAVDATASGAKLGANNDWAQINEKTILSLAGVPNGATLTFVLYENTAITINGTEYTNGQTFTSDKDQNITMTCTTGGYIKTITVVGTAFVNIQDDGRYTNTWYFGKSNGAPEFALERTAEYEYTINDHSLVVNTDAGKLNNASRTDKWAQCNDGTLFKVPVYAGSKLTWDKYNTGNTTGFNIGETLYNEYYVANEEGTVNMSASGISYLNYIKIEPVTLYEISGTVTGGSIDGASVCLTATNGQVYQAEISSGAFTASVPGGSYDVGLSEDVAYVVNSPSAITVTEAGSVGEITITAAPAQTVTGQIINAPAEAFILTFTGNSHNESVECAAGATSYEVTLDPDTYVISSNVGTLSPLSVESFKIVKDAATHNIYYPEVIPAATQQNITVDNTLTAATANNYKSVSDALAAAKAGSISAPVITLTSGQTYREQVIVDQANVTLKTSSTEKAKITFYYGLGYCYYSLNENGYYDKDRAMTRNSKLLVHPARWGCTVKVTNQGNNFYAENIIFENSFNQYYTDEEVTDGVEAYPMGDTSITYDRTLPSGDAGYKVADVRGVTERAAAIAFENNPTGCEVYNCAFIGSQDTYFTSGSLYAKNCDIQGNTDYIYGGGKLVFDNCNLVIGGYSDQNASAYITAQKGSSGDAYIFRDCTVTSSGRTYVSANLGRDWGGASATVYYFNLKNNIGNSMSYTWSNMGGGVTAGTANLHIYDFDATVNANYSTTGSTGANINGLVSDADALTRYADVVSFLGFTPKHIYDDNVVLDESSAYNVCRIAASDNVERTVDLTRSLSAGNWSTIVLPFAMAETKLKAAFGEDVKVAELTGGNVSEMTFSTVKATEANKPYAIKVGTAFSSVTIEGVTIVEPTETEPAVTTTDNSWIFNGTYSGGNIPSGSYYFKANKLYLANGKQTVKPFRAYFTPSNTSGGHAAIIDVAFDGETTGITNVNGNVNDNRWYNLNGQRVGKPAQKGLYIVNGKKVVKE